MNDHVESRGHAIWLTAVITPVITGIFVFLRMYTRIFITRSTGLNDCKLQNLHFDTQHTNFNRDCFSHAGKYTYEALRTNANQQQPFIIAYSVLLTQGTHPKHTIFNYI